MDRSYKPQGYCGVSAYVVADGAQGVIDFLAESFDAKQRARRAWRARAKSASSVNP